MRSKSQLNILICLVAIFFSSGRKTQRIMIIIAAQTTKLRFKPKQIMTKTLTNCLSGRHHLAITNIILKEEFWRQDSSIELNAMYYCYKMSNQYKYIIFYDSHSVWNNC